MEVGFVALCIICAIFSSFFGVCTFTFTVFETLFFFFFLPGSLFLDSQVGLALNVADYGQTVGIAVGASVLGLVALVALVRAVRARRAKKALAVDEKTPLMVNDVI